MWTARLLSVVALFCICSANVAHANEKMEELRKLSAVTPVIPMTGSQFIRFASGDSRPYSFIVFFNAVKVPEAKQLMLSQSLNSLRTLAKATLADAKKNAYSGPSSKIFFVEIDMSTGREVMLQLGVQNLPWAVHLAHDSHRSKSGNWNIGPDDTMTSLTYGRSGWTVSDFNSFMKARARVDVGNISQPTALQNPLVLLALLLMLVPSVYGAWQIYTSKWIRQPWIWTTLTLAIFMFATSGGLHNIIRGVPLVRATEKGVEWFQHGNGQLGMEGFTVGSMYVLFAIAVCGILYLPDMCSSAASMRVAGYAFLFAAGFLLLRIVKFYTWKTGYNFRFYLAEMLLNKV